MKKYFEQPALQVVSIQNNVIATSGVDDGSTVGNAYNPDDVTYAPGRRFNVFDQWYEGY